MALRLFKSLRGKVLLTAGLVLVVMVGTANYVSYRFWERQVIAIVRQEAIVLARTMEASITTAMMSGSPDKMKNILAAASQERGVASARVVGQDGTVKASSDPRESGKRAEEGVLASLKGNGPQVSVSPRDELGGSVRLVMPIVNRPLCHSCHNSDQAVNGALDLRLSMSEAFEPIIASRNYMLAFSIATIVALFVALYVLFKVEVTRPVSAILKTLSTAKKGDLNARVPVTHQDELGAIGESLNSMLRELQRNADEIAGLHRKELRKSERLAAIGQLAAGIAHEIKNPLAGIRAALQIFQEDLPVAHKGKMVLEQIVGQIDRLDTAVKDLLTFSRPPRPVPRSCNVNELVDASLKLAFLEPSTSGVNVVRKYQDDLPPAWVDPELMQQAFLNVIQNSVQAMPSGGKLIVKTARDGAFLEISFTDTGVGIPEDNLEEVFKPFFTTKHRGTGLGLSITQNIVAAHGGEMEVSSIVKGGTTMTFVLPLEREAEGETAPGEAAGKPADA